MWGAFFVLVLGAAALLQEKWGRAQAALPPLRYRRLFQKAADLESERLRKLGFMLVSVLLFSLWENFARLLFGRGESAWLVALGVALLLAFIFFRRLDLKAHPPRTFSRQELVLLWAGFSVCLHAWVVAILLSPWLFWRARLLPRRSLKGI